LKNPVLELIPPEGRKVREFDHIGLTTTEKRPDEMYVESTKVWVTNPADSPEMVEYLRYEPDSPVTGPLRELPHVAFRVDDLDKEIEGEEVILGPFNPNEHLRVVFIYKDGLVYEFMESSVGKDWHKA
jgi:hypothetical protein